MSESLVDLGLALVCETCECEIDFPDATTAEVGVCRECGIAFLVDAVMTTGAMPNRSRSSAPTSPPKLGGLRTATSRIRLQSMAPTCRVSPF